MPSHRIASHLAATRRALDALLRGRRESIAVPLGLAPDAAQSLCWVRQAPLHRAVGRPALTLGFTDGCSGRALPSRVRSPLDGSSVPVRSVRSAPFGTAHAWVRATNVSHQLLSGSLGAVLRDRDDPARLYALTAGHVLGACIGSARADMVQFDFDQDAISLFGKALDWAPKFVRYPVDSGIDAGIAEIEPDEWAAFAARPADWPTGVARPFADDALRLRTGRGDVEGGSMERMSVPLCIAGDTARAYQLVDVLCWRTEGGTQGGDSGAPLWNAADGLVGIHAGAAPEGSELDAVAVPIDRILEWAGCDLVRRGEPLRRPALARGRATPQLPVPAGLRPATTEAEVLARTMWGEARGEPDPGMAAVGNVVLNRVAARSWWGRSVIDVCQKPWQFSCWNARDPNRSRLLAVTAADAGFRRALDFAGELLAMPPAQRAFRDVTNGATHYFARRLVRPPAWAAGRTPCARIGGHDFFKDIA